MNKKVKFATVESVTRLRNSSMGDPAWLVTFTDGTSARTTANGQFAFEVTETNLLGKSFNVHMTRAGRIIDMRRAEKMDGTPGDNGMEFIANRWVYTGK